MNTLIKLKENEAVLAFILTVLIVLMIVVIKTQQINTGISTTLLE